MSNTILFILILLVAVAFILYFYLVYKLADDEHKELKDYFSNREN